MFNKRFIERGAILSAAVGVGVFAVAGVASAHVSIEQSEVRAGAYELVTVGVPHGCDGSPTTEVRIQMPESIVAVTPTVNPNWDVEKVMLALDEPITVTAVFRPPWLEAVAAETGVAHSSISEGLARYGAV